MGLFDKLFNKKSVEEKKTVTSMSSSDFLDDIISGKGSDNSYSSNNDDIQSKLNIMDEHQKKMDEIAAKKRELLNLKNSLYNDDELNHQNNYGGHSR